MATVGSLPLIPTNRVPVLIELEHALSVVLETVDGEKLNPVYADWNFMGRPLSSFGFLFLAAILFHSSIAVAQSTNADRFKHAAPEKCVAYVMWNAGDEKPIEGNKTQALMADPQVRAFVDDLKVRAGLFYPATVSDSSLPKLKLEMVHWLSPRIVEAVLDRPGCLFIEELTVARGGRKAPDVKGAMLLQPEGDVDRLVKRLTSILKADDPSEKVTLAGVEANRIEMEGSPNPIVIGNLNGTCLIALSEKSFTSAIERMKAGKAPTWLTEMENKASKLEHVHTLGYIDIRMILRAAKRGIGMEASTAADFLGLGDAESIELIGGLNKVNSSLHLLINTTDPEGILELLANESVNESIMLQFPADSLFAGAVNADLNDVIEIFDTAMLMLGAPGGFGQQVLGALENELGIEIEDDLLDSVGETWGVFNGAADGVLTGTTVVGEAKDPANLNNLFQTFCQAVAEKTKDTPPQYRPMLFEQDYEQSQIFSMRVPEFMVEWAVGVKDNRFYIGLFPEPVISAISDDPDRQPLLAQEKIAQFKQSMFLDEAKLTSFAYVDSKALLQNAYPLALLTKESLQLRYGPFEMNQNLKALAAGIQLPPARILNRHLDSVMGFVRAGKSGIEVEFRQTVPTNFAGVTVPALVGGFLPAAGGVRSAAQETRSLNNLRQIALACLNYESAYMSFPGNTSQKRRKDDENKFSWRVHILPFIEQNDLYSQIRFDEPWDSEHNKTLMAKMPDVFKSPGSTAAAGMTLYRGFGEGGILGGDDEQNIGFGSITDGSSNTILAQEVDEELATPWMKPECLKIEEAVLKSIYGKHRKRNVAMGDGSVHSLPSSTDVKTHMHLAQRGDGNVVNVNARRNQRRRDLPEPDERFVKPGIKRQY